MRHSYHSSSSSLGSMEPENSAHINVHELINNGVKVNYTILHYLIGSLSNAD